MVSGLAMCATGSSPLRPKRLPISARVARSPSESRQPGCQTCLQNAVLGRQVLILQQELLVDQSGNVGQKPRACGCVRPTTSIIEERDPSVHLDILTVRARALARPDQGSTALWP
jgi:hypothetical protein